MFSTKFLATKVLYNLTRFYDQVQERDKLIADLFTHSAKTEFVRNKIKALSPLPPFPTSAQLLMEQVRANTFHPARADGQEPLPPEAEGPQSQGPL